MIFSDWWEDLDQPHRILDQYFGLGINPQNLVPPRAAQIYAGALPRIYEKPGRGYYRPWGELLRKDEGGSSTVKADKHQFQVVLDVQQFAPEEINVKVVDRFVVVEGKHEEKQDEHGWISRQFTRRYMIPEQCDIEQVTSKLSSDGVLSISVPRKEKTVAEGERVISIEQTGKPAIRDASKSEEKKPAEEQS